MVRHPSVDPVAALVPYNCNAAEAHDSLPYYNKGKRVQPFLPAWSVDFWDSPKLWRATRFGFDNHGYKYFAAETCLICTGGGTSRSGGGQDSVLACVRWGFQIYREPPPPNKDHLWALQWSDKPSLWFTAALRKDFPKYRFK